MARKTKSRNTNFVEDLSSVTEVSLLPTAKKYMYNYGSLTVENRALPDYRDGCKPVYRRILYAAYRMGKHHNVAFVKSARIVGEVLGLLHPHGDTSVYGAVVTMANMPESLLDKHGNFGSPDGDSAAAQRYTEIRLSKYSDTYLLDPKYLAVVPMVENYDGTTQEPVYLPSKLPNILVTGAEGIAVGCTTLIPSFSKDSVINLVTKTLKSKKKICTPQMCLDTLEFNFQYGGRCTNNEDELLSYYKTGEAKLTFAPKLKLSKKNTLLITSLCPRLKPSSIYDNAGFIKGVKHCNNIYGKNCSDWAEIFPANKKADAKQMKDLAKAVAKKFSTNFSAKTLVTERQDDGVTVKFKRTNVPDIVNDWINWRLDFEVKVVNRLIDIEKEKIKKWKYLIWAVDNLTLVFKALKSNDPDKYLVENGDITEEHAKYILDQQTRRLSKLSGNELKEKVKNSKEIISSYKKDISSRDNISKRIVKDLTNISN